MSAMSAPDTSASGGIGWRNLRTGLLFILGIALAGTLGLIIGKNTGLFTRHDTVHIFVEDIKGLTEGNMVSISGKKVGTVTSMRFTSRNDTSGIIVDLEIRGDYFGLITKDSRAVIKSLGVLGDKYIDISLGRSNEPLADGGYLQAEHQPGVEDLTASALKTMDEISSVSEKINNGEGTIGKLISTSELHDRLANAAAGLEQVSQRLLHGKGTVSVLLNDEKLAGNIRSTVSNLNDVATTIKSGKGTLGKLFVDESLYQSLSSVARHSDSLMARLSNPNGSLGKFSGDAQFYNNLNHSLMSLDSLLTDLKQNPGRYVKFSVF